MLYVFLDGAQDGGVKSETGGSAAPVRHRRRRRLVGSYNLMKGKLSLVL